ncbi:MAG: hypothetical protein HC883_04030 [Bdellovibrionaceae bacterium]|nr:hypothetical protein [Pseudobdellovibrionaceae bacterium]
MKKILTAIFLLGLGTTVYALNFSQISSGSVGDVIDAVRGIFTNPENTSGLTVTNEQTFGARGVDVVGEATSGQGVLRLRNSTEPFAPEFGGSETDLVFQSLNDADEFWTGAVWTYQPTDSRNGQEDGIMALYMMVNGAFPSVNVLEISDTAITLNRASVINFPNGGSLSIPSGSIDFTFPSANPPSGQTYFMKFDNNGAITGTEAQLGSRTKAQLLALTPTAAGIMYYCSNCTTDAVVVSTGTGVGAFARVTARTTAID